MLQRCARLRSGAWVLAGLMLAGSLCAMAADDAPRTFVVDTTHTGPEEGTSTNPDVTIGAALARVEAGRGDTVLVRGGTYQIGRAHV